ncbi:hypothetical protein T02_1592 [Trichinella nativa]|uniref:Uncharacterized protein n=1 Tax=Trichinella nativa TaxID=6335 RepID=A0A0V1LCI9_9BILA|nr:hypothetical protein T02_1592 [Trichinella nativa]
MFLFRRAEDYDVIEINQARFTHQTGQSSLHEPLKRARCIAQSERHYLKLVPSGVAKAVFSRSRLSTSTCQYPDARSNVVNHLAPAKASSVASIRGNGCASFRSPVVDAEPRATVLLLSEHHRGGPRSFSGFNQASFQHSPYVALYLFSLSDRQSPQRLFDGFRPFDDYSVFHDASVTQIIVRH